jgi:hypothetical protein
MNRRVQFTMWCFLIFLAFVNAYPQKPKGPTHLVLAVTYINGRDPAFQTVPWSDPSGKGTWYAGFVRVESFRPAAGEGLVQAIRIVPEVEGDAVRVKVWTMYGERLFEKELPVGTYVLPVDGTVRVGELKKFGVQPFEMRLFKVLPSTENLPSFATNAPSISALNVQPNDTTLPSATVKLRNLSYKDVTAIGVNVMTGDKVRNTAVVRADEGRILIEAGGMYDLFVRVSQIAQAGPKGSAPVSAPDQKVFVTSVLFRDGTIEGDPYPALRAAGYNLGAKIMLGKLLPIFEHALASDHTNTVAVLEQLQTRISALTSDVNPKIAEELAAKFPSLSPKEACEAKNLIDIGSGNVKSDMLRSLDTANNRSEQKSKDSFDVLLVRIRDRIKEWHDRL